MKKGSGKPIPRPPIEEFKKEFTIDVHDSLIQRLKTRFEKNIARHADIKWDKIETRLKENPEKLLSLYLMDKTGGEPDVVHYDSATDEYIFYDCSEQSPEGRRSIVYDRKAEEIREKKGVFPGGNVLDLCETMGIEVLDEAQYRKLQETGEYDTKTSSWIATPSKIRKLSGAIFADRRYDTIFVYHNSAHSFYGARGFRGLMRL